MSTVSVLSIEEFTAQVTSKYTDVIGAKLGGKVLSFSDEWFAEAANLIVPTAPIRQAGKFTPAGAWFDGWETRRHNTEPADWVIFELGVASAKIAGVEVDTAFFNGNHAPAISVEGAFVKEGEDVASAKWEEVIAQTECGPSQRHFFKRELLTEKPYTHARLNMFPDGGIARFRLYGEPTPVFPEDKSVEVDLAHVSSGGVAVAFSDQHFGSADNLLIPGRGVDMGDGWETKRSREPGHTDWVIVRLGAPGTIDRVVVDTAHFMGNFPQSITVHGLKAADPSAPVSAESADWTEIVPQSKTTKHTIHEYTRAGEAGVKEAEGVAVLNSDVLSAAKDQVFTHAKLTIIPDGGVKRFRVFGKRV